MIRSHHRFAVIGLFSLALAPAMAHAEAKEGYYASLNVLHAQWQARNMATSARPGIGSFVPGDDDAGFFSGSIAAGYRFGNGWRTEGEYTVPGDAEFTSGSSRFVTSLNHHQVEAQRIMLNGYRDFGIGNGFSVYATAGIGVARVEAGGWQGVATRQFAGNTVNNLAYSVGTGVSYAIGASMSLDLGYRYVDMGQADSGFNTFANVRGLQDEQMRSRLVSSEALLGVRYAF